MTTINEVQKSLKKTEYCVIDKKDGLVIVYDRVANAVHGEERVKRVFQMTPEGELTEVDVDGAISQLVDAISEKVELKQVLAEVLRTSTPDDIMKALTVLKAGEATIETGRGCMDFTFKNKEGKDVAYFAIGSK